MHALQCCQVPEELVQKGPLKRSWNRVFEEASARVAGDNDDRQSQQLLTLKSGWQVLQPQPIRRHLVLLVCLLNCTA